MYLYNFIVQNKELIKIFYGLIIVFICLIIVLKADRLFRLSMHKGIRYFRNAFFFYGIGFLMRYILGTPFLKKIIVVNFGITKFLFEFFMIMAGFFLLYSLIWKKIEVSEEDYPSSLLNKKILIFYIMTLIFVILDFIWQTFFFMFFSQIVLFFCASIISFVNYKNKGNKNKFLKFYFIAMILSFLAWTLNALTMLLLNWNYSALITIYILNMIIFLLFLYGVINVTKKSNL